MNTAGGRLYRAVRERGGDIISVVGLAKNVGKTTALNALIAGARAEGLTLGLTSTGRDGEASDILTRLPKPAITAAAGTLVATAADVLRAGSARLVPVEATGEVTCLGEVLIARCEAAGTVQLVGPDTMQGVGRAAAGLRAHGAELAFIDGAFDRVASAAPAVSAGTVLATGAALDPVQATVVGRTALAIEHFQIPPASAGVAALAAVSIARRRVAVLGRGGWRELDVPTALGQAEALAAAMPAGTEAVAFGGALTQGVLEGLLAAGVVRAGLELVVADATRIFCGPGTWGKLKRAGAKLTALSPIRLLAVTVNPWSPASAGFPAGPFLEAIALTAGPLPVFDLVANTWRGGDAA